MVFFPEAEICPWRPGQQQGPVIMGNDDQQPPASETPVLWSSIPLWGPGYVSGHGFTCLSNSVPSQPSFCATLGSRSSSGPAPSPIFVIVQSLSHVWLLTHGLQHTRLLCPSLSIWVCSNSCPLSQWCYPTISPSAAPSPFVFSLSQHQGPLIFTSPYCSQGYQTGCKPAQLWWWSQEIE